MDQNLKIYSILEKNSVSRETCIEFEHFISLIIENNKKINLISRGDEQNIRERHIIDCAQAFDFIDLNSNICIDLGSGNGMPGIILAIMMKNMELPIKFNLYEKSYHKSKFLESVSKKLNLVSSGNPIIIFTLVLYVIISANLKFAIFVLIQQEILI